MRKTKKIYGLLMFIMSMAIACLSFGVLSFNDKTNAQTEEVANAVSANGGAMYVGAGTTATLGSDSKISGITGATNGGAIYVAGTLNITGGTIENCSASYGGAIYVADGGIVNMSGGTISGCSATSFGGGIYVAERGVLNFSGGTIKECSANYGGGIASEYGYEESYINGTGGLIKDCSAEVLGGGIYCCETNLKLQGTLLYDCTAGEYGGGVYSYVGEESQCTVYTLKNMEVINCEAYDGGGLYFGFFVPSIEGSVTVGACNALNNGGGIYVYNDINEEITISAQIAACTASNYGGGIYIDYTPSTITINSSFTDCGGACILGYALYISGNIYGDVVYSSATFSNCGEDKGNHVYDGRGAQVSFFVDGSFVITKNINEIGDNAPLSLEECCGWFFDSSLKNSALEYQYDLKSYGDSFNLYTKTATVDKLNFVQNEDYSVTVSLKDSADTSHIVIPAEYGACPVWHVAEEGFANSSITGITFNYNLLTIGNSAFYMCQSIQEVIIPDYVDTLGVSAFMECYGILAISLPDSLVNIGSSTFALCSSMFYLAFEGTPTFTTIPDAMFAACNALESVVIPDSVVTIEANAFTENYNLVGVKLGSSVQSIGMWAFSVNENLQYIYIPSSVTTIDTGAFYGSCSGGIYTGHSSAPSGWVSGWNNNTGSVSYNYTYSQYITETQAYLAIDNSENIEKEVEISLEEAKISKKELETLIIDKKEMVVFESPKIG